MPDRPLPEPAHESQPAEGIDATVAALVSAVVAPASGAVGAWPAAVLNPAAGNHLITADPRELRAALRAGEATRRRFPYYEQRYGDRGRRFTQSDSAWIVTLPRLPHGVAERQLRWLGALLAGRGMPRWLLEEHLVALHAELVLAAPDQWDSDDVLLQVSALLRDERLSRLDAETTSALAQEFDRRVGPDSAAGLPEAGALLVAAVADELAGVDRAVESLVEWLADPARFPEQWVAAVSEVVAAARELAG